MQRIVSYIIATCIFNILQLTGPIGFGDGPGGPGGPICNATKINGYD